MICRAEMQRSNKETSWFGKGCKYLSVLWEDREGSLFPIERLPEPILKFCNHEKNVEDTEGNCRSNICPVLTAVFSNQESDLTDCP